MWLEGPYIYVFIKNTYIGALYCGNFYCLIIMLTSATDDGLKNQENDFNVVALVIDEKLHKNRLSARWLVFMCQNDDDNVIYNKLIYLLR